MSQNQRRSYKHNWAGVGGSNVAITAEGDPEYHFCKVRGKQTTSALITDDNGTQFPQALVSYKDNSI